MKNYFYDYNNEQIGPIPENEVIELIKSNKINTNTLVWYEGIDKWKPINKIEIFKQYLVLPPPIDRTPHTSEDSPPKIIYADNSSTKKKKKRKIWPFILAPLLLIIGYFSLSYYQYEKVESERRYEEVYPSRYLRIDNLEYKSKLIKDRLKGTITNTSSRTTFGEIQLEVKWYDKKDNVVSNKTHTINKLIRPHNSEKFEIKSIPPFKAKTYNVKIIEAETVNQY